MCAPDGCWEQLSSVDVSNGPGARAGRFAHTGKCSTPPAWWHHAAASTGNACHPQPCAYGNLASYTIYSYSCHKGGRKLTYNTWQQLHALTAYLHPNSMMIVNNMEFISSRRTLANVGGNPKEETCPETGLKQDKPSPGEDMVGASFP